MDDAEENRVDAESLETQLFSWDGWDGDEECQTFYKPILKVKIGKHPAGTKFDSATILWTKSVLQLENHGPMKDGFAPIVYTAQYDLKLSVADTLNE